MFKNDTKQTSPLEEAVKGPPLEWRRLLASGIITILIGIAAVLLPFLATIAIEFIAAVILLIAGAVNIIHALHSARLKGMAIRLLSGILYGALGVILLLFPLTGALTLTIILAILFILSGIFKIIHSLSIKPLASWVWLMFSGILSLILGIIIWFALPQAATWVIGLLLGIELLITGSAMTAYAVSLKNYNISSETSFKI